MPVKHCSCGKLCYSHDEARKVADSLTRKNKSSRSYRKRKAWVYVCEHASGKVWHVTSRSN